MLRFPKSTLNFLTKILNHNREVFIVSRTALVGLTATQGSNLLSQVRTFSETANKSPLSNLIAKDATERIPQTPDPTDEEREKQRKAAWKTMKTTLMFFGVAFVCIGGYIVFILGAPEKDPTGKEIRDDLSELPLIQQYFKRAYRELDYYGRLIKEPSREKLLPDPLEPPYIQPKYTLVLELTGVLVHPDWTYTTGWRFKKRPGLDSFLENLHTSYEIVVYTAEQGMTLFPLVDAIDPKHYISYKLPRDATHFSEGHHVKSLNNLNRDLSKVIVVDWNQHNVKFNQENLFHVKRWTGNDNDTSLFDLMMFLQAISQMEIEDVREVLKTFHEFDDPLVAFRDRQKRYIDMMESQAAAKKDQEPAKLTRWAPSFLRKTQ